MALPHRTAGPATPPPDAGRRNVRRAWLSLVLLPVSFAMALLLGDRLLSLQGYGSGNESVPSSAAFLAGGLAVLVLIAPAAVAVLFGRRARKQGDPAGGKAAAVGGALVIGLAGLNLLALLIGR